MKVKISELKENPNNPRVIRDANFLKLVKSIREFPEMLSVRKIVCTPDKMVLGGNMRLKALKEAGIKEVDIEIVNWSEDKQKEFIIKDNIGFGEWDFEMLANEWEIDSLKDWGLDIPGLDSTEIDLDSFFMEKTEEEKESKHKIILEYTEEDYDSVIEAFKKHAGTKEEVVARLLGL
jgi:hypothetical protein